MKRLIALGLLAASPAFAGSNATTANTVSYACADNEILQVVYVNGADGNNFAIIQQAEEMVALKQAVSGSGVHYTPVSKDYSYELFTKGNTAQLEDQDGVILADCTS